MRIQIQCIWTDNTEEKALFLDQRVIMYEWGGGH